MKFETGPSFDDKRTKTDEEQKEENLKQVGAMIGEDLSDSAETQAKSTDELQGEAMQSWIDRNSNEAPKTENAVDNKAEAEGNTFDETSTMTPEEIIAALDNNAKSVEVGKKVEASSGNKGERTVGDVVRETMRSNKDAAREITAMVGEKINNGKKRIKGLGLSLVEGAKWLAQKGKSGLESIGTKIDEAIENTAEAAFTKMEKGMDFASSVAKNMGNELKETGAAAVDLAVESGKAMKKGAEFVRDKAAEKLIILGERSVEAFGKFKERARGAKFKFMEGLNNYKKERLRKKSEVAYMKHLNKIVALETKIKLLEGKRKGENNKKLGRLSTEIGQTEIDLKRENEKWEVKMGNKEEVTPNTGPEQSNVINFAEAKARKQQETSDQERFKEAA